MKKLLTETYPQSWNWEFFKTLKSFKSRADYCAEHLIRLDAGTSRIIYKIDEEKVIKLAKNAKGLAQNEVEIQNSQDYYLTPILAEVFDYDENNLWLEMEFAQKLTIPKFKQITGYSFEHYADAMIYVDAQSKGKRTYKKIDSTITDGMWENEDIQPFLDYVGNYNVPIGDLLRISSYGIVQRNNQDSIVLIDFGLDEDVQRKFYSF